MLNFENLPRFKSFQFEIFRLIGEWANVYDVPKEAVIRQIGIAHVWCNANPKRAPKKDPVRFLHNWMRIANQLGNLVVKEPHRLYQEPRPDDEVMTGDDFAKMRETIRTHKS